MNEPRTTVSRRELLKVLGTAGAAIVLPPPVATAAAGAPIRRAIPASGEVLPVIGMGSARTFDVGADAGERAGLGLVLRAFFDGGGTLVDTSPMYGAAETVLGDLLATTPNRDRLFVATKVWTTGRAAGIRQMERSMVRLRAATIDLMQVHNLVDWQVQLETLAAWKAAGRVRYVGITTSHGRNRAALEQIMRTRRLDFVQFSYSIADRSAERRLLPLAADRGIATLINRPYERGSVFRRVRGTTLPAWAREFDCASWGQFFLKFIVSHPAATCAIPATSKVRHMVDNMGAGFGRLPDAAERSRMVRLWESL